MANCYTDGTYLAKNPTWHSEDAEWKLSHILRALQQAHVTDFHHILDAGCGSGAIIKAWAAQAAQVQFTGWDISPQALALAVQNVPQNVQFASGNMPPAGPFDIALAIDVIEHIPSHKTWLDAVAMRAPVLVLHVPLDLSVRSFLFPQLLERERESVGHIHFFTARSLKKFLEEQHYEILSAHYTNKYVERPPQLTRLKSRIGMFIRQAAHRLLPRAWTAFFIGGYSLMLTVKTTQAYSGSCSTYRAFKSKR